MVDRSHMFTTCNWYKNNNIIAIKISQLQNPFLNHRILKFPFENEVLPDSLQYNFPSMLEYCLYYGFQRVEVDINGRLQ